MRFTNKILRASLMDPMRARLLAATVLCLPAIVAAGLWSKPAAATPLPAPTVFATAPGACNKGGFFGLEPWYHFMPGDELGYHGDPCAIHCFNFFVQANPNDCNETASDIPGVILAVVDDMLQVAAMVAVAFILVGSFQFVGSRGNSERTASAQSTILNALIGLAISLVAVGLVAFIGHKLGG